MTVNANRIRNDRFDQIKPDLIANGYVELARDRQADGWRPYLVTLMFRQMPGNRERRLGQMRDEAYRVYRRFLTRLVRRPRSVINRNELPVLILMPDLPVGKSGTPLKRVSINGGLHMGGVLLEPPRSRLRVTADEHFRTHQEIYLRSPRDECEGGIDGTNRGPSYLNEIDVRPVDQRLDVVVNYALKSLQRGRFTSDDIIVFPRALSELGR